MARDDVRTFGYGWLMGWCMHLLQLPVIYVIAVLLSPLMGYLTAYFALGLVMLASATQVVYMVPMIVRGIKRGERAYVSGLCCAGIMLCLAPIIFFIVQELRRPLP